MRGGDVCGVSALEPHLVHTSNEAQPGRHPRRSGRRDPSFATLPQSSSHSYLTGRGEGPAVRNGFPVSSGGASSIMDQELVGNISSGGKGEASVRSGDGGLSALGTQPVHLSKEPEPGRRRSPRSGIASFASSSSRLNGRGASEAGRNGAAAASSSMRSEPAVRAQRVGASRDRSSVKRARGGTAQNRLVTTGGEVQSVHVNNNQTADAVLQQGRNGVVRMGDGSSDLESESSDQQHQEGGSPRERVKEYFPLINDELGSQCLARLPRHGIYKMALVCRKWREFLMSPELYKSRRLLGVREDWVFILGLNQDKRWRAFRPQVGDWVALPPCPSDYTFDNCDKESMVAGLNLLVLGQNSDGYVIWKYDTIASQWSFTPRMHSDRCMFGSATSGKYAYFAGGSSGGKMLKSVERYDSETNSWELLAEMKHDRKACSGFVMDGKFHVIGGHVNNELRSSGEAYDPQTGTWTEIEGMWPNEFVPSTQVSPPLVAVLNNELYAVNITKNMLMRYHKELNAWDFLEKVPFRAENNNGWGLGFKAVSDELFVIGGARGNGHWVPKIHAYRPRTDGGETWRLVTDLKIPTNGFIYNCAVMSG